VAAANSSAFGADFDPGSVGRGTTDDVVGDLLNQVDASLTIQPSINDLLGAVDRSLLAVTSGSAAHNSATRTWQEWTGDWNELETTAIDAARTVVDLFKKVDDAADIAMRLRSENADVAIRASAEAGQFIADSALSDPVQQELVMTNLEAYGGVAATSYAALDAAFAGATLSEMDNKFDTVTRAFTPESIGQARDLQAAWSRFTTTVSEYVAKPCVATTGLECGAKKSFNLFKAFLTPSQ
jgi:hypothetical protein